MRTAGARVPPPFPLMPPFELHDTGFPVTGCALRHNKPIASASIRDRQGLVHRGLLNSIYGSKAIPVWNPGLNNVHRFRVRVPCPSSRISVDHPTTTVICAIRPSSISDPLVFTVVNHKVPLRYFTALSGSSSVHNCSIHMGDVLSLRLHDKGTTG